MSAFFAEISAETLADQAARSHALRGFSELWLIVLAMLLVAALVFVGVILFRKPPKHVTGTLHTGPLQKRVRRRRRRHRPRNPSLAETGGLPPRREDESPSAS